MNRQEKILEWLSQAGAEKVRVNGSHAVACCPFHRDSTPSFAISLENGLYICYSAKCGASGNIFSFLVHALHWSFTKARAAASLFDLPDLEGEALHFPSFEERRKEEVTVADSLREAILAVYEGCPTYLLNRGFDKAVLQRWEIGYDAESRRVVLPVRQKDGKLVGVSKRATWEDDDRPYLHLYFRKKHILYGENRVDGEALFVVEGQLDAIAFDQLFGRFAVATMGTRVSKNQIRALRNYKKIILAFDNDDAGRVATKKVGDGLLPHLPIGSVMVARSFPQNCKDIADMISKASMMDMTTFFTTREPYDQVRLELGDAA